MKIIAEEEGMSEENEDKDWFVEIENSQAKKWYKISDSIGSFEYAKGWLFGATSKDTKHNYRVSSVLGIYFTKDEIVEENPISV